MRAIRMAAGLALASALMLAGCGGDQGGAGGAYEKPEDRAIGEADAPVTVVEYASITCPGCKAWHDQVWDQFRTELVETGRVRFVFRELPTGPLAVSTAGFLMARCVPENRYFGVLDTLFDRQSDLVGPDPRSALLTVARGAGLSEEEFNTCIRDEEEIARINDWVQEARDQYGITGTPSFLINGEVYGGGRTFEAMEAAVAEAAAEAGAGAGAEE